jgi:hypothetical protein
VAVRGQIRFLSDEVGCNSVIRLSKKNNIQKITKKDKAMLSVYFSRDEVASKIGAIVEAVAA